ncbi:MAG: AsmA family protein [Pseudomonadota bacterium]
MKAIKWLLIGTVGLVLLVFTVVAVVLAVTDLNRFKPEIEAAASDALGRQLTIEGELNHSLFPWLGVSFGRMQLANADGFGDTPFAEIASAEASIEILPLLRKQITVGNINLTGVRVDAQIAADGSSNIPVFAGSDAASEPESTEPSSPSGLPTIVIDGVSLVDADIRYRDATADLDAHARAVNLTIGNVRDGQTSPITGGLKLSLQPADIEAELALSARLTPTFSALQFVLDELALELTAEGAAVPGGQRNLTLTGNATADLTAGTASLSGFDIASGDASARLDVGVTGLNDTPAVTGNLTVPSLDLGALLDSLELSAGPMQREDALSAFALDATLSYSGNTAALDALTIRLDDTTLTGAATLGELDAALPAIDFELAVDRINMDHYSPPLADGEAGDGAVAGDTETAATGDTPIPLPIELMRALKLNGTAEVASLTAGNLTMQDITVELDAADGEIAVSSLSGALYDGGIDARLGVDVRGETPQFSAAAALSGVQAQPLLNDFAEFDKLLGSGLINLDIATAGNTVGELSAALGGTASFSFVDGAIDGINIAAQLRRVLASFGRSDASDSDEPLRTDFAKFSASADIVQGVIDNVDLDLRSPLLRLAGQGTVSLPGETVDYLLKPALVSSLEGQGGATSGELSGLKFDLPIVGTFSELASDFTGVLRRSLSEGATAAAKAQLDAAKAELEAKAKAELDARKAQLQAEADAREAEARAELDKKAQEKVDEVKDKLADKLKKLF